MENSNYIFRNHCKMGNFSEVKNLIEERRQEINLEAIEQGFISCCEYGHFDIAIYLYDLENINIRFDDDYAFYMSCMNGHLDISKWLYELSINQKNPIYIYGMNEFVFRYACIYGHILTVKWLYNLSNCLGRRYCINIDNDYLFRKSCIRNHLEVAIWLYNEAIKNGTYIDIHSPYGEDEAFIQSCKEGNVKIVKWLCEICSDYSYNIKNDIIEYKIKDVYNSIKNFNNLDKANYMNMNMNRNLNLNMNPNVNLNVNSNININININIDKNCMICFDNVDNLILPCNHIMCMDCFIEWYIVKKKIYVCIFCMKIFELNKIIYNAI